MKKFSGKVLFLDRNNINTDEIIPAKYLTEITKEALKPYLLEDLKLEGFNPKRDISGKEIIITRENFGCGSSREHAPWALEVNSINVVIAPSFARIFRQNMFNCGMIALELPEKTIDNVFSRYKGRDISISVDIEAAEIIINDSSSFEKINFTLSEFDKALIQAGGWVEFADARY